MFEEIESDNAVANAAKVNNSSMCRLPSVIRASIIFASVIVVVMMFASDIDGMIKGSIDFTYSFGCSLVTYSAGFVRRGLLGEGIQLMNAICQPFLSLILLISVSVLFVLLVILFRMIRLKAKLPYIIAIILSPSLVLMPRGDTFVDVFPVAMNIAASCLLLHLIFRWKQASPKRQSYSMLAVDCIIFILLTVSALIHELSATLLPPVILIFFIYARKAGRIMHAATVTALLLLVYTVMMAGFKYSVPEMNEESWSGIFGDPNSFKHNTALLNITNKTHALNCIETTLILLREAGPAYLPQLLLAVAVPFTILLLSGITIFHSSSSRAHKARCLLVISCTCPLGLCLVGNDFGRWFSICAINLTAYSLLIAHPAGRTGSDTSSENERMGKNIVKQCVALVIAVALLNSKLGVNGYFYESDQSFFEQAEETAINSSNLLKDLKPLITREIVLQPRNGAKKFN